MTFRATGGFYALTARPPADLHKRYLDSEATGLSTLKHVLRLHRKVCVEFRPEQNGQSRKESRVGLGLGLGQTRPQSGRSEESSKAQSDHGVRDPREKEAPKCGRCS